MLGRAYDFHFAQQKHSQPPYKKVFREIVVILWIFYYITPLLYKKDQQSASFW